MTKRKIFNWSLFFLALISLIFFVRFGGNNFGVNFSDAVSCFFLVAFLFVIFYFCKLMSAGDVKLGALLAFFTGVEWFFISWLASLLFVFVFYAFRKIYIYKEIRSNYFDVIFGVNQLHKNAPYGAFMSLGVMIAIILKGY
jgi:Flp pilus assembly protein protease CpaA